jgi:hypothetical protein
MMKEVQNRAYYLVSESPPLCKSVPLSTQGFWTSGRATATEIQPLQHEENEILQPTSCMIKKRGNVN